MENNDILKTWKDMDNSIDLKSKEDLNNLLNIKIRKTINKFLYVLGFSIIVCSGLIIFLTITALNRKEDLLYQLNNLVLGVITIVGLVSSLYSWYRMQNNRYNQTLKKWLEEQITPISKELTGRFRNLYMVLIPLLYTMTVLSIHVYYEEKPLLEVLHTEESITALLVGAPIGLFVAFLGARKIRKLQLKNLEHLKELHKLL
jgi:hypothetical protein